MELRGYQIKAVSETRAALAKHRAVCLVMQVGAGKTVVACEIIKRTLERGRRCLFVVHRVELVEQARDRLARFGINAGIIKAGYPERRERPVQIACVPTLVRREFPPAELTIIDECHHAASESWLKVAKHYRDSGWLVGITACPQRLDGRGLGSVFDVLIEPVTTSELLADGYLIAPTVYVPPDSCDRRGLHIRGGDFALPEIAERMQKLTGSVTEYWLKYGRGRRTLAFAVNIDHSRRMQEALEAVGARAAHVDGTSSKRDRTRANQMLREGRLDVVTQCALWTEGVDIPEIDCLIVARPTQSLSLHRQMLGRGLRPADGKSDVIVLDHAGNHLAHGLVTDSVEWSLDAPKKKQSTAPAVRTCPECFAILPSTVDICPCCGAACTRVSSATPPAVDNPGELVELNMSQLQMTRAPERNAPQSERESVYKRLVQSASFKGRKLGAARAMYKERFGEWPRFGQIELENYTCASHELENTAYGVRCKMCLKSPGAIHSSLQAKI